jgi:hypothetical protein
MIRWGKRQRRTYAEILVEDVEAKLRCFFDGRGGGLKMMIWPLLAGDVN